MKRISKSRLFTLLCRQSLDRLQIKVVIQMEVIQILAMDQQIQHIESLSTNLQSSLDPINFCTLEKLCGFQLHPIIERRLFIIKRRKSKSEKHSKPHSLEMSPISLFSPHLNPHSPSLRNVDGLNHSWNLVDKRDCSGNVVQHFDFTDLAIRLLIYLFPGHGHVFEQLQDCMWHVL
jgi:hypothetical protein